eukprot:scaffold8780_cov130-Isochrysis_galbana.AAC.11
MLVLFLFLYSIFLFLYSAAKKLSGFGCGCSAAYMHTSKRKRARALLVTMKKKVRSLCRCWRGLCRHGRTVRVYYSMYVYVIGRCWRWGGCSFAPPLNHLSIPIPIPMPRDSQARGSAISGISHLRVVSSECALAWTKNRRCSSMDVVHLDLP